MAFRKASIWVHTLVKNESNWLWFSIESIINHVDKILLWDSGSTDATQKIIDLLVKKYPGKIEKNNIKVDSKEDFAVARQKMLDVTNSDWFMVVDGDEIWWDESIRKVVEVIQNNLPIESIVVPTINLVGDIYHYQEEAAGKYNFAGKTGHYNLRAIKRNIPGLHSKGNHGVWGWVDEEDKMVQDRGTFRVVNAPYLHATHIARSTKDKEVVKRAKKMKYEIGLNFPKDFYYPESFFISRPDIIPSPWQAFDWNYKIRAYWETPLRKIKRRVFRGGVGY